MRQFLSKLDSHRIVEAIAAAEKKSSGEIRVHVTRRKPDNLEERARRRFELLGMTKTALRNGVLIYIARRCAASRSSGTSASTRSAATISGKRPRPRLESHFRRGEFTEGIVNGIAKIGDVLATHFPREAGDVNELPDQVTED